jgi:hypothetical protein
MKKKWIAVTVVVLIALIGFLAWNFMGNQEPPEETINLPEEGEVSISEANLPSQVKIDWEKRGVDEFELVLKGALVNISDQTVKFSSIVFYLDGEKMANWPKMGIIQKITLEPGESEAFRVGGIYSSTSKVVDIEVEGFEAIKPPTTSTTPPEQAQTPTSEPPTISYPRTFEKAPANLDGPDEVAAAFVFYCSEGKIQEAEQLLTQEALDKLNAEGGLELLSQKLGGPIEKLVFAEPDRIDGESADVYYTIYFEKSDSVKASAYLILEGGTWKIDL